MTFGQFFIAAERSIANRRKQRAIRHENRQLHGSSQGFAPSPSWGGSSQSPSRMDSSLGHSHRRGSSGLPSGRISAPSGSHSATSSANMGTVASNYQGYRKMSGSASTSMGAVVHAQKKHEYNKISGSASVSTGSAMKRQHSGSMIMQSEMNPPLPVMQDAADNPRASSSSVAKISAGILRSNNSHK